MAMMAACSPAARLWRNHSSENGISGSAIPCNQFAGVRWSSAGVPAVRIGGGARRDVVVLAGKKTGNGKRPRSGLQARRKPKSRTVDDVDDDDEVSEKALEALFAQLEMDLNSEGDEDDEDGVDDGDEEFTDEELAQMTKDLEAAFSEMGIEGLEAEDEDEQDEEGLDPGLVDMVMNDGVYSQGSGAVKARVEEDDDEEEEVEEEDDEDDDDDEQRMVPLEKWQLRKLAAAVEQGRRNVNIKSLSAELGMDRADVLSFLRDPPPELLLMSAQLDEEDEAAAESEEVVEAKVEKAAPRTATTSRKQLAPPTTTTSGGPQSPRNWHGSKRLKKEHLATFERVYRQTNRPSNAMIENLVNLTHVPRKKVLQWFDDRRAENQPKRRSFEDAPEN